MSRKVIVVVVEGKCEKLFMIDRLEEVFDDFEINFSVVETDVFSNSTKDNLNDNISNQIKKTMDEEKFTSNDILCIVHIADTDGCFIDDACVIVDLDQGVATKYRDDNISVKSEKQKNNILKRNKTKRENKEIMIPCNKFEIDDTEVDYQLFYCSRCLDHVLFNEPNPRGKTKVKKVEKFIDDLSSEIEDFLATYLCGLNAGSYRDNHTSSWTYIKTNTNSLKRLTNVSLLFRYIVEEYGYSVKVKE